MGRHFVIEFMQDSSQREAWSMGCSSETSETGGQAGRGTEGSRLRLKASAFVKTSARQVGAPKRAEGSRAQLFRASRQMPAASLGQDATLSLVVRGRGRL